MDLGMVALRGVVGGLFAGHGAQKLFGWFGGHGIEGTGGFFESKLGLRPGKRHATAAGLAELGGGALLVAGALTPAASAALSGTMITAMRTAHAGKGPWVTEGGWEYNLVLLAALFGITSEGPGRLSVDGARGSRAWGPAWALAALAAGAAGSYAATATSTPEPQEAPASGVTPVDEPRFIKDRDAAATDA